MKTISSKISDEEYQLISDIAKEQNISISLLIKQAIFNAKIQDKSIEKEKLYHYNKIGNNLNQIARKCNLKNAVDKLVLEELISIKEELKK